MSLNTGSIVVINALYTYRLIGPNSQGVKRASLMHTQHKKTFMGQVRILSNLKRNKIFFICLFYSLLYYFILLMLHLCLIRLLTFFQSYNCSQLSCKRVLGQNAIKRFSIT